MIITTQPTTPAPGSATPMTADASAGGLLGPFGQLLAMISAAGGGVTQADLLPTQSEVASIEQLLADNPEAAGSDTDGLSIGRLPGEPAADGEKAQSELALDVAVAIAAKVLMAHPVRSALPGTNATAEVPTDQPEDGDAPTPIPDQGVAAPTSVGQMAGQPSITAVSAAGTLPVARHETGPVPEPRHRGSAPTPDGARTVSALETAPLLGTGGADELTSAPSQQMGTEPGRVDPASSAGGQVRLAPVKTDAAPTGVSTPLDTPGPLESSAPLAATPRSGVRVDGPAVADAGTSETTSGAPVSSRMETATAAESFTEGPPSDDGGDSPTHEQRASATTRVPSPSLEGEARLGAGVAAKRVPATVQTGTDGANGTNGTNGTEMSIAVDQPLNPSPAAGGRTSTALTPPPAIPAATLTQLQDMRRAGETRRHIVVRLDPPNLGSVTLELTAIGSELHVAARAENADAARALLSQQSAIHNAVQTQGMSLGQFDVHADSQGRPGQRWNVEDQTELDDLWGRDTSDEPNSDRHDEGAIFL